MTLIDRPDRCCPKCQNKGYMLRARKHVEVAEGNFVDTKYRCRSRAHERWKRIPAPSEQKRAEEAA